MVRDDGSMSHLVRRWVSMLRSVAEPVVGAGEPMERQAIVQAFLAATDAAAMVREAASSGADGNTPDVRLWRALCDADIDVDAVIGTGRADALFPQDRYSAIEVWTESDLCGLHALWRLAHERGRSDWLDRAGQVRDWHLEHTQPDNATNRPWSLHIFVVAESPESDHYAQTLLHNCQAVHGRPDPLSARILLDAALMLETHGSGVVR